MTDAPPPQQGTIWTFYSYKGGVGRSLALANVAVLLASWGYRTLCVDWDLEAPGLQLYFDDVDEASADGVLELVAAHARGERPDWRRHRVRVPITGVRGTLDLIRAGRLDGSYVERMQELDWEELYESGLGSFLEDVRGDWKNEYDFTLIDSRTGITDIGGICTVQLPDYLAVLFTPNKQSIDGALDVARRASEARDTLPFDRTRLSALPVITRFEGATEVELARKWLGIIEQEVGETVASWLDRSVPVESFVNLVKVPYIAHWSFGERLPVLQERGSSPDGLVPDPLSISYAFETIAALVAHNLEQSVLCVRSRTSYVEAAIRNAAPEAQPADKYDYDVFVSYDAQEEKYARALMSILAEQGLRVWSDTELHSGEEWSSRIEDALVRSRNMVALVTTDSSRWLESEARRFLIGSLAETVEERVFVPVLRVPAEDVMGSRTLMQFRAVDAVDRAPAEVAAELAPILAGSRLPAA